MQAFLIEKHLFWHIFGVGGFFLILKLQILILASHPELICACTKAIMLNSV
jgi:hypothetical protein